MGETPSGPLGIWCWILQLPKGYFCLWMNIKLLLSGGTQWGMSYLAILLKLLESIVLSHPKYDYIVVIQDCLLIYSHMPKASLQLMWSKINIILLSKIIYSFKIIQPSIKNSLTCKMVKPSDLKIKTKTEYKQRSTEYLNYKIHYTWSLNNYA